MRPFLIFLCLIVCCICDSLDSFQIGPLQNNLAGLTIVPAQWSAKHYGHVMLWPTFDSFPDSPTSFLLLEMFATMTNGPSGNNVYLLYNGNTDKRTIFETIDMYNEALTYGAPSFGPTIKKDRVIAINIPYTDMWARDYLSFGKTKEGECAVVDFDFNAWGYGGEYNAGSDRFIRVSNYFSSISNTDTQIAPKFKNFINSEMGLSASTISSFMKMEAGGLEFNNDNVNPASRRLFLSEAYLTQPERNYGKTIYQLVRELYRVYSLQEIIVLPKFRFNRAMGVEEVVEQCPFTDAELNDGGQSRWSHCFDVNSWYYTGNFGGGLVADDSSFQGSLKNEDSMERRIKLGFSDPVYDNVITAITTNGHTDEWIRWVGPNTVLLADVPNGRSKPKSSIDGRTWFRLNVVFELLKKRNINVVRVPTPVDRFEYFGPGSCPYDSVLDMFFTNGEYYDSVSKTWVPAKGTRILDIFPKGSKVPFIAARSYLNYVVTDDHILVPEYYSVDLTKETLQRDRDAARIIGATFANTGVNRTVVSISNVDKVNFCGGGMHCITQNFFK